MGFLQKQTIASIKKKKVSIIMAIVIVMLVGCWWTWGEFGPKPLGDRLEYIGKEGYGCLIGLCDSQPTSIYYYGTDMAPEEVKEYFKNATFEYSRQEQANVLLILLKNGNDELSIEYFYDNQTPFKTNKKAVISILGPSYNTAKRSL